MSEIRELKDRLKMLMNQRSSMEAEALEITERLNAPGQPGLSGGLIDKEGYPRADIDVARVRGDRHKLACLQTDHKSLSSELERLLAELHAATRLPVNGASSAPPSLAPASDPASSSRYPASKPLLSQPMDTESHQAPATSAAAPLHAFAVVDDLADGSPAALAGIQVGDRVCDFGGVRCDNVGYRGEEILARVAQVLSANEGRQVAVTLLRHGRPVLINVSPQRWSGRGLLGCHLQPLV